MAPAATRATATWSTGKRTIMITWRWTAGRSADRHLHSEQPSQIRMFVKLRPKFTHIRHAVGTGEGAQRDQQFASEGGVQPAGLPKPLDESCRRAVGPRRPGAGRRHA